MSPIMGWPGRAQRLICRTEAGRREARLKEHAMRTSQKTAGIITTIGIDLGKNTFHLIGFDQRIQVSLRGKSGRSAAAAEGPSLTHKRHPRATHSMTAGKYSRTFASS